MLLCRAEASTTFFLGIEGQAWFNYTSTEAAVGISDEWMMTVLHCLRCLPDLLESVGKRQIGADTAPTEKCAGRRAT